MHHPSEDPDREAAPPAPRWVNVFGVIALALLVLLVIALLVGGDHGPGRHSGLLPSNSLQTALHAGGHL